MEEKKIEISIKTLKDIIINAYGQGWYDSDNESPCPESYCGQVLKKLNIKE